MEIEKPHGNSVDMRKNLSGIVNYGQERQNNFSQNSSNIFVQHQHQNQSYNEYNNNFSQQPHYINHNQQPLVGGNQLIQNTQAGNQYNLNPIYKANNFFSNNQPNTNNNTVNNNNLANKVNNTANKLVNQQIPSNQNNNFSNNFRMHNHFNNSSDINNNYSNINNY